ncbi:MAG: hypothetical protein Q8R26_02900 [bacterium]|nr:hypothetical protein [bacterium]
MSMIASFMFYGPKIEHKIETVFVPIEVIKVMGIDYEVGKEFFAELLNKGFFIEAIKQESIITRTSREVMEYG